MAVAVALVAVAVPVARPLYWWAMTTETKLGEVHWKTLSGPAFWEFDGETLDERRRRMEGDD